ncbi:MAG: bifunctional [glutamate--ammonia ligase]-adenylyl-L-tyrosine phosphorylase/[glutamate--ammonia-ligase] adenylyltransferase [Thermodesulfovibrionales bacterium]
MLEKILEDAASATPDPERSLKNLQYFCEMNPQYVEHLRANIRPVSLLFSFSQFLSNFAISNPDILFDGIRKLYKPIDKTGIGASLKEEIMELSQPSMESLLSIARNFKKRYLLLITLRDILNIVEIVEIMLELSLLADAVVEESLRILQASMREAYGEPADDGFSIIAVGKLGGEELNFSSDIDLLYVYGNAEGETSGVMTSSGIVKNRISNHEYYCKLGENLNRFLSINTEDGFVYRVDTRLRPEGQRGSLAQSLSAYEMYYESWGRAWERAVLLRARPIAGDTYLGSSFIEMIKPFVYRKYLDFSAIDEIRRMKTRIDEAFKKDDIKRGYGGIREIEFFVHALQLIYGGKEQLLRERSILKGLHRLLQKNLIGHEDYSILSGSYIFLRKLEHRLQQLNDLQTHSIPSEDREIVALSRRMGFSDRSSFISELENRRRMVRIIYDSLFMEERKETAETSIFFSDEVSDSELRDALSSYPIVDVERAIRIIRQIRDSTYTFQTLRARRLLSEVLPAFLLEALKRKNPDDAINNLQSFAILLASNESYLELFAENKALIPALTNIFSRSEYLSKNIVKRLDYLELLGHEMFLKRTVDSLKRELVETIASGRTLPDSIRMLRQMEEIRLGILFLDKKIDAVRLIKGLSKTADAVVSACIEELIGDGFVVIGMGKAGGRELTFASDLDLIFACKGEITESHVKAAERIIRLLTSYTKDGIAYRVDVRLRPDGAKGPLVSTIDSLESYYLSAARFWELQALLKARTIAGDRVTRSNFLKIRRECLKRRGKEVSASDIRAMRERIQRELSKEANGYDIKLGPGGIEELEFTAQYLQLSNCHRYDELLVQGTLDAIKRLKITGVIDKKVADFMKETYIFYRTLESLMRLKGEQVLKKDGATLRDISEFMGFRDDKEFLRHLQEVRGKVREMFERFLS